MYQIKDDKTWEIEGEKDGIVYKIVTEEIHDAVLDYFFDQDMDSKKLH